MKLQLTEKYLISDIPKILKESLAGVVVVLDILALLKILLEI